MKLENSSKLKEALGIGGWKHEQHHTSSREETCLIV